jgi:hypothetical protein
MGRGQKHATDRGIYGTNGGDGGAIVSSLKNKEVERMAGYIYLPVNTEEMRNFAKDWREGQREKGKRPYEVLKNFESGFGKGLVRGIGLGVLRGLSAQDKLYVVCHGLPTGSRATAAARGAAKIRNGPIIRWEGGTYKVYKPDELAAVMEKEGLLKSFVDVRLFVCGSAVVPQGEAKSFAEKVFDAMKAIGYNHIAVTGYLGSVGGQYGRRPIGNGGERTVAKYKAVDIGQKTFRPSDYKEIFSSRPGAIVLDD